MNDRTSPHHPATECDPPSPVNTCARAPEGLVSVSLPEDCTRSCELEATLRHHHAALLAHERSLPAATLEQHHVGEARRLVALAVGQLYLSRRGEQSGEASE